MFGKRIFQQFSRNRAQTYKVTLKDRKDLCKEGIGYTVRELSGSWSRSVYFLGLQFPCRAGVKNKCRCNSYKFGSKKNGGREVW
jgi:hypothetical protein